MKNARRGFDGAQRRRAAEGWGEAQSTANQSLASSLYSSGVVVLLLEPLRPILLEIMGPIEALEVVRRLYFKSL
jgi:hypothetical protein